MIRLGEVVMIHDLKRQGLSISAIARKVGLDRKTVRKHLEVGVTAPVYGPRAPRPRLLEGFEPYLHERILAYPDLSGRRLLREIRGMGYDGGYTAVTDYLREVRPGRIKPFERRFETPAGRQSQVDFAQFRVEFTDEPGVVRIVWLFTMVLGHSRWLWGRFCATQDLQTVMRCHIDAFTAMGGAPQELLYDRMKTAVIDEDAEGVITYNSSLVALLTHYGALPRACRPYRAKTKGKVERPYRYVRQDFFLARTFRNMDDLNAQFEDWRTTIANSRLHATTRRIVNEHFAEEHPHLTALPVIPYSAVLTVERRVSHEGMVSVGGNLYSVPDATRKRVVEVQNHPREIRIFEDRVLIAVHPVLEGKNQRRTDPSHRKPVPPRPPELLMPAMPGRVTEVGRRPLAFYDAVAKRMASGEGLRK
ncbi:IS21 family transposase (plasmid) [Limimaricola variabilis]|uniref:IS21 family transposase n=1 Tax=Limimaricola variabilis TaxID=1492771 RepID=UPI002AC8B696|nr:IS21 family transposase [Limimaricola variabilis]WPY96518.1 IS21 family transposase [Limimaricola variabilis]